MSHKDKTGVEPESWKPIDGFPGWLVLMDYAQDNKNPRLVVSEQDQYFLTEVAKSHYPNDTFRVVVDDTRKLFVRKVAT